MSNSKVGRRSCRSGAIVTTTIPITAHVFCRELLRQLQARLDPVAVVSSEGPELAKLRSTGLETICVPMARDPSPLLDAMGLLRWILLLLKRRPLLVVALTPKASLLALFAAMVTRVPHRTYLLVGLRLDGETGLKRRILTVLERLTSTCATDVIANSPSLHRRYLELGLAAAEKLSHTAPGSDHGVDTAHFTPRPHTVQSNGQSTGVVNIGFVGRLTADKGIETLAHALSRPSLAGSYHLILVGSQEETDSNAMLQTLSQAGVSYSAHGSVHDVRPLLSAIDLLVLPTRREGFPNVVLEASAMGIPTVTTTAVGAVDSVIDQETGLLVPVDDTDALEAALLRLIASPAERHQMGKTARRHVEQHFDPTTIVRQIVDHALRRRVLVRR